jgi:peroxiredoxin
MNYPTRPKPHWKSWTLTAGLIVLLLLLGGCSTASGLLKVSGKSYFIDCQAGKDTNAGTSPSSPWGSLEKVNGFTFSPGDGIFFKRGTKCAGTLWPKGSGSDGKPVTLATYGTGALPVIDGGKNEEAFKLRDQQYWQIQDMEFTGGTVFGVLVSGSDGSASGGRLHYFRLTDLVVHDVYGSAVKSKTSGLVIFLPGGGDGSTSAFDDVILDGITAYNTNQWAGISILGNNQYPFNADNPSFGTNITIRNATVHNVYGDGITLFYVKNGLIESSVAYDTGQQPSPQTIGTPSSIWTWSCYDCTVQYNESYRAGSPDVDAGDYDIDWGTRNNLYQYNYGHDSGGYCMSVFGAGGLTTSNAVLRYNICANDAQRTNLAVREGDVFLSTWEGGQLDGVQIYNNTFYWNPAATAPVLLNHAAFTGLGKNTFANNLIYSTEPWLIESDKTLTLDHNLYWYPGSNKPVWYYNNAIYNVFGDFQRLSQQEAHGIFADPRLNDPTYHAVGKPATAFTLQYGSPAIDAGMDVGEMGQRDYFGHFIPVDKGYDIGASEWQGESPTASAAVGDGLLVGMPAPYFDLPAVLGGRLNLAGLHGRPVLLSFIDVQDSLSKDGKNSSHSQVVFLKSLYEQYAAAGLQVVFVAANRLSGDLVNMTYNWEMNAIPLLVDDSTGSVARSYQVGQAPATLLIGADGRVLQRWDTLATPFQLAASLQAAVLKP